VEFALATEALQHLGENQIAGKDLLPEDSVQEIGRRGLDGPRLGG
jgi:hypothetical protein